MELNRSDASFVATLENRNHQQNLPVALLILSGIFMFGGGGLLSLFGDQLSEEFLNHAFPLVAGIGGVLFVFAGLAARACNTSHYGSSRIQNPSDKIRMIARAKLFWLHKKILIVKDAEFYAKRVQLIDIVLSHHKAYTSNEGLLAFAAIASDDFLESGFSRKKTEEKWLPVLNEGIISEKSSGRGQLDVEFLRDFFKEKKC